jgi:TolB protein
MRAPQPRGGSRIAGARLRRGAGLAVLLQAGLAGCGDAAEGRSAGAPVAALARALHAPAADAMPRSERAALVGRLVFVSERGGTPDVYVLDLRGGGERPLAVGEESLYPAAVSPDGSSLAVLVVDGHGEQHLERLRIVPLSGDGAARDIGPVSARVRAPAWSPGGDWLYFESDAESFRDIYRMRADGSALQRLGGNEPGDFEPSLSPDGRWVVFASSRDGDAEIYRMSAAGGAAERLTAFHREDVAPQWSPAGDLIAFVSNREGHDRIFLMSPDGTGQRRLTREPETAGERMEEGPVWSPAGDRIAYVVRERGGRASVWIADLATGRHRRVPGEAGSDDGPVWSPDGAHLAFVSTRDGDADLYVARADGSAPTRLTRSPGADWLPRWVP